jgi:hypothetical protein
VRLIISCGQAVDTVALRNYKGAAAFGPAVWEAAKLVLWIYNFLILSRDTARESRTINSNVDDNRSLIQSVA